MLQNNSANSKTLAKNTLYLYLRMMFNMLVSLYTSRVILEYLGAEDFGIYNVVGGVVTMFSIISGTLSTSVSRNLTFALGEGDIEKLKKVFSISINVQVCLVAIVVILAETIGVWFLNNKMVIPDDRMGAANWILQFSIMTFCLNLINVPYSASLISHEKMSAYAYIGILEIVLKLIIVFMLLVSPIDKLVAYGFLLLCVSVFIVTIYQIYCRKKFEECSYHYYYDKCILKELLGFAGWNFLGCAAMLLKDQGLNIMLNLFVGPIINAARAIATQVNAALNSFVANFMTALNPQITKAYAQHNTDYLLKCIYDGARFSYFLLFFLSLPVLLEAEGILKLWLVNVPETTVAFVRFIILQSLADTISRTNINANNATGNIRTYQIVIGTINLLILPCTYIGLKVGMQPEYSELIVLIFMCIRLIPGIYIVKKNIPITLSHYATKVFIPVILTTAMAILLSYMIHKQLPIGVGYMFVSIFLSVVVNALCIIFIGITRQERIMLFKFTKSKIHI